MFNIEIAGITIGIDNKYDYTEKLAQLYKTDKEPMFTVKASEEDIEKEGKNFEGRFSKGYFESLGKSFSTSIIKCGKVLSSLSNMLYLGENCLISSL